MISRGLPHPTSCVFLIFSFSPRGCGLEIPLRGKFLPYRAQRLIQIPDDIVQVFDADGEADEAVGNP